MIRNKWPVRGAALQNVTMQTDQERQRKSKIERDRKREGQRHSKRSRDIDGVGEEAAKKQAKATLYHVS